AHLRQQQSSRPQMGVAIQRAPDESPAAPADAPEPPEQHWIRTASDPAPRPIAAKPEGPPLSAPTAVATQSSWFHHGPTVPEPMIQDDAAADAEAADSTAPDASAAPAAPELDLDDLARRVYGQVRTQLRAELLIDRERAGLLTDFR
ncbi:MAG: hypothetical protein WCB51_12475, partial [Candidatus Dormiibacterota bacterium]